MTTLIPEVNWVAVENDYKKLYQNKCNLRPEGGGSQEVKNALFWFFNML